MKWPGRTPLSRLFREKRHLIVPLALAAIANLAALLLIVYPLSRRVAATEQRAADVTTRLAVATNDFRNARAMQEGRAHTDTQLVRFYEEVLPRDRTAARRITYLKLVQLAHEANLRYERRSFNVEEVDVRQVAGQTEKGTLTRMDIEFPLFGQYRDIRRFIHTLETAPQFIAISHVALRKGGGRDNEGSEQDTLALTLRLATYYRTADEQP